MRKFSYVAPQLEELEALYDGLLCASPSGKAVTSSCLFMTVMNPFRNKVL